MRIGWMGEQDTGGGRFAVAWRTADGEVARFELAAEWRGLGSRFAPHEVVKAFVGYLLAVRPQRMVVESLSGVTLELARVAHAFGCELVVGEPQAGPVPGDEAAARWLQGLLEAAQRGAGASAAPGVGEGGGGTGGYEAYAFGNRDHALLLEMQQPFVEHFRACGRVLDLGCGTGIFLEALTRAGIAAEGVERNPMSVRYARTLGLQVIEADALDFLATAGRRWDGVYCSHFVEHLPVDVVDRLLAGVAGVLEPGGVAVLVFPDPESIRSQLLGFWRDPEHVRFYHAELVATMAAVHGLELEFDSTCVPGRRVVPFAMEPALPQQAPAPGRWARLLGRLGVASRAELAAARAHAAALEDAVRQLWAVNQTWAWEDNAVLRLRRRRGA